MTSNNPCAVYNFYNCCCNGNGSSPNQSALFVWHSGNVLGPHASSPAATLNPLAPIGVITGNTPNAARKAYQGLLPLHRKAQLKEIMLLRFADQIMGPPYTGSINFDLVVLDYAGVLMRQISTVTLNYELIPLGVWTPITLSSVSGDLDVLAGQVIAGQLTFSTLPTPPGSLNPIYQLSGTGVFL